MTLDRYVARLIAWSILPMLLLVLSLGAWLIRDTQGTEASRGVAIAEQIATIIDRELESYRLTLQIVTAPASEEAVDWRDLKIQTLAFQRAFDSSVLIVDERLSPQFHTGVGPQPGASLPPLPEPVRETVRRALLTAEPVVGNLGPAQGPGSASFDIAVRIGRSGGTHFAASTQIQAERILTALDTAWLPENWSAAVIDSKGTVVANRGPERFESGARADVGPGMKAGVAGGSSSVTHHIGLNSAPWTVVVAMPVSERLNLLAWVGVVLVIATLIAVVVSVHVGKGVGRRLRRELALLKKSGSEEATADPTIDEVRAVHHQLLALESERNRGETERRTVETALRGRLEHTALELQMSQARLRGIFDSVSDAIITTYDAQIIVMANPAAAAMFRCPLHDMLGTSIDRFIPEKQRDLHRQWMKDFGAGAARSIPMTQRPGVKGLRADGTELDVEATISCVNVDGQRLFNVILRDVTEREQAQEVLRASKAKLATALASMSDAVSIADTSGTLVEFNAAYASFHRYNDKESMPRTAESYSKIAEFRLDNGPPVPLDMWPTARALRGETGSSVEYTIRRKDTGESWVGSYSFAPILGEDGSITGTVTTARDVTELYRVRAELVASQASLRRLLAAQDSVQENERKRIARELHDELQQILAAIRLDASSAATELAINPQGVQGLLTKIEEMAASAIVSTRRIVNDLRPQMLEDLGLVAALEALAMRFSQRNRIACEVQPRGRFQSDGEVTAAVATCLYRVTQEALNNVVKHAGASTVVVQLTDDAEGNAVLSITDDGSGLAPADRRKPDSYGLHGMDERVRALKGRLHVSSRAGTGTTVKVVLPLT